MIKKTIFITVLAGFAAANGFAAKERLIRFQNHVRIGHDDNIYSSEANEQDSAYITDIINLSAKFHFSSRTDALLYWQPEFRYRFDADPEDVMYNDLFGSLNHALSPRVFMKISDRLRYQDREGQALGASTDLNENYLENDLNGSLDITVDSVSQVSLGAGYGFREWDESQYGAGGLNNDYTEYRANGRYSRELSPNRTTGLLGANYSSLEFDDDRGGYDSVALFGGVDQNFNPNLTGFGHVGVSMTDVDTGGGDDNDSSTPYVQAGLDFNPTARTSLNGTVGYSVARSQNSFFNSQEQLSLGLGARHDVTAKINLAASLSFIMSDYDSDNARFGYTGPDEVEDEYMRFSLRASYQINRNNFVEAGYQYQDRSTDQNFLREYTRNMVDVGWRLRL